MYPNYNYPNVPSGSGGGAHYPYMQPAQPPLMPMAPQMPHIPHIPQPMVPPVIPAGYNDQYAQWAQWNPHFGAMNPTQTWRNQAAAVVRPTPYDRPVTIQHQIPYGGRPHVPRDLSGPNANTMRDSFYNDVVPSTSNGPPPFARPELNSEVFETRSGLKGPPVPAALNQQTPTDTFYQNVAPTLEFDVHVSSTKLDILWKAPHVSGQITYHVTVTEGRGMPFTLEFPANHTRHSIRAKAGESYVILIVARKNANNVVVAQGQRKIKAIFSDFELRQLYDKAVKYTGTKMHPFQILYRCKPKPYWDDIHHNCRNVMEKYMKDDNGQPANMINGVISGLFFSARLLPNGTLPYSSPFGNVRMLVQAAMLLDPLNVNIYFADFYCNKTAHYVTIIVARKGSDSDIYSQKYLMQLDMRNNPWLKYMLRPDVNNKSKLTFSAACNVWVEVLWTENVPLSWGRFDKIQATGIGTSKIGGLSNNKSCVICNLYPPGAAATATSEDDETRTEEKLPRRNGEERRKRDERSRSRSPDLQEEEENIEPTEALNSDDDLDGVELPAYEMGGNSTFQTLINQHNFNSGDEAHSDGVELPAYEKGGNSTFLEFINQQTLDTDDEAHSDDDLDGVELSEYEMGGNSTFQTLINQHNLVAGDVATTVPTAHTTKKATVTTDETATVPLVQEGQASLEQLEKDKRNDCPNWTDLIECVCEMVDGVVATEQQERERQITNFNSLCDSRVEKAIEEMDSIVGTCDDDKIHDLAGEVHELADWWQNARAELAKMMEAREAREEKARATRAALAPSGPAVVRKRPSNEEDLDEYLEDDDVITTQPPPATPTAVAAKKNPFLTPSAMTPQSIAAAFAAPSTVLTPSRIPLPPSPVLPASALTPQPQWPRPSVAQKPNWLASLSGAATVSPVQVTVAPAETSGRIKKREQKRKSSKKEELDEYLDNEEPTVSSTTQDTVEKNTTEPRRDTVNANSTVAPKDTVDDLLGDSAIDLTLFDEVGDNESMLATPATALKSTVSTSKATVSTISIEGEDEWLEEDEEVVALKRSADDEPGPSNQPVVAPKKTKTEAFLIDLTEEELLGPGSGPCSYIEITPEMEEELLKE